MARGVKAWDITLRRLFSSGGSMLMMVGKDPAGPMPWMSGPSTAVNGVRVAVNALRMPVLGRHPEVAFDRLRDAFGQLVVKDRPLAAQLDEQIVGKTVLPQRRI